jgi:phage terminase large subunit-like protein
MTQNARFKIPAVFEPLWQPARYKGAHGGRGSGKSHNFAAMAVITASKNPGFRLVCVREVQKSLRESAKRLIEDKITAFGLGSQFEILSSEIRTPGGGTIIFQGMQDHTAETVKSLENFQAAWVEEAQTLSARSLELLRPTIRSPGSEIWASWNPRNASDAIDQLLRGLTIPKSAIVVEANYTDNQFFTQELEDERLLDTIINADRYGHIWLGHYEPQYLGAIFTRQVIHEGRRHDVKKKDMERILVGVDPAVSTIETNKSGNPDMHGISVCGKGGDDRGYVLEDASTEGSPHHWATRAVAMYDKWDADAVVIERNQGGDMCKHTLQTIRKSLPVIEVTATRGKHVRAEPISAMYNTGMISHVGTFTEMEDQLCKFTSSGYEGEDSPDRAEAMIWCMTELFEEITADRSAPEPQFVQQAEGGWMG